MLQKVSYKVFQDIILFISYAINAQMKGSIYYLRFSASLTHLLNLL